MCAIFSAVSGNREDKDLVVEEESPEIAGFSPATLEEPAHVRLVGWGARIRTWEWRNQNPDLSLSNSMVIPKKTLKFARDISIG
jgi:hypothetical protein